MQVLVLISEGYSVDDACEEIGITERQYRHWIRKGDDTIEALREMIIESERIQLADITAARTIAIQRIIDEIPNTARAIDLIAIDSHLRMIQRELEDRHGAHGVGDEAAKDFLLNGPKLQKSPSRMYGPSINVKPQPDGSVDIQLPIPPDRIIDVDPKLHESP